MENTGTIAWRKSTYSGGNGGQCVEAGTNARSVLVRDTTDRAGVTLTIPPADWQKFIAAHK
jgi:hypothetical protein